jgi:hypothetical protein
VLNLTGHEAGESTYVFFLLHLILLCAAKEIKSGRKGLLAIYALKKEKKGGRKIKKGGKGLVRLSSVTGRRTQDRQPAIYPHSSLGRAQRR